MLLIIDNLDSFTYNLAQYFQIQCQHVKVLRSNNTTLQQCLELSPTRVVISPGPGSPNNAGISNTLIKSFCGKIPIFGVCLGLQCIATFFGANVMRSKKPVHGKISSIFHNNKGIFQGLPQGFSATRYHSLIVEKKTLPSCLEISAETSTGEIMGLRHKDYFIESVQFHPESILTESGMDIIKNFINLSHKYREVI